MFSSSFAVVLLIIISVNGQNNDINTFHSNSIVKGYPFGKLRLAEDGKYEELIPSSDIDKSLLSQDQLSGVQPLPSPCIGALPSAKLAYPKDKTKYILCRDEFHYEIFTCPNGGDYVELTNSCDLTLPILDKCQLENPCLNDGQCSILSNSTFKCTCRADWTGERCEIPKNSCVKKPCGPNAECRPLKTNDYDQDYICLCNGAQGYGLNCQETVPNPCLTINEQFFPYAFSQHAYIQCNGELIYFQPCGPILYWNQEEKNCDRKRPPKLDLPALLTKYTKTNIETQQEKVIKNDEITLPTIITTTEQPEQQIQYGKESEPIVAFVPARIVNRQQVQGVYDQNIRENEQIAKELPYQSVESSQVRQDLISRAKQWPNHQTDSTIKQPSIIQSGQNQRITSETATLTPNPVLLQGVQKQNIPAQDQLKQHLPNTQFSGVQTPQAVELFNSQNFASQSQSQPWQNSQFNQNQQQFGQPPPFVLPSQGFQQPNNQFGGVQTPQAVDFQSQNNQNFALPSQSWQGTQNLHNQQQFTNQNQQPFFPTTTVATPVNHFQNFQNPNTQFGGVQAPQSVGFNPQNTQNFGSQTPSWQSQQTLPTQSQFPNQHQQPFVQTPGSVVPSQGFQQPNNQFAGAQTPQGVGFPPQNNQNFGLPSQSWQGTQNLPNQQQFINQNQQPFFPTTTVATPVNHFQNFQNPNTQFGGVQTPQSGGFNSQNFGSQAQPWQNSQFNQNQPLFPKRTEQQSTETSTSVENLVPLLDLQNSNTQLSGSQSLQSWQQTSEQPPIETTTTAQNFIRSQTLQNPSVFKEDLSWKTKPNTQNFVLKQQPWQASQTPLPNQQQSNSINPAGLTVDSIKTRLNTGIQKPNQYELEEQNIPHQSWSPNSNLQLPTDLKNILLQNKVEELQEDDHEQDFPQQTQAVGTPQWLYQVPEKNTQRLSNQIQYKNQNLQILLPTTTIAPLTNRFQSLQNPNTLIQSQIWQNQPIQSQPINSLSKHWPDTPKQILTSNPTSDISNTQFGFNQQQTTNEQRKSLDTLPTVLSGTWKPRK